MNIKSYVLNRMVPLTMTLNDLEPDFARSQYRLKMNISQTVHHIHSTFGYSNSSNDIKVKCIVNKKYAIKYIHE